MVAMLAHFVAKLASSKIFIVNHLSFCVSMKYFNLLTGVYAGGSENYSIDLFHSRKHYLFFFNSATRRLI
jgi:hypothetical protein